MTDKNKNDLRRLSPNRISRSEYSSPTLDVGATTNAPRLYRGLSLRHWLYLIAFGVITLITWVTSQNITQFKQIGPEVFQHGFPGDLEQWARHGNWENIVFEQDRIIVNRDIDKPSYAVRTFALPPSENRSRERLRATGTINTLTKRSATDLSDGGALMVWLQDDTDEVVKYLNVGKLDGLSDSYDVSRVVNLTDNITRFSLVLTNKETSAEFALVDAAASLVTEQPLFLKVRAAIFLAWALMLLMALYYVFLRASPGMFVVIVLVISLTITGILMPESISSGTVQPIYTALQSLTGLSGNGALMFAYKIGHFVFFFLSSLILLLYRKTLQLPVWEIYFLLILFAITTEGLQLYLSDRTTRISDLLIDFSAILAGALLATIIIKLRAISSRKSNPPAATF